MSVVRRVRCSADVWRARYWPLTLDGQPTALRLVRYYRAANDQPEREITPFTREEVGVFLEVARTHYPREYPLFLCAVLTGMRLGELLGLQWDDIDFHGGFIVVRRGRVRNCTTSPKSGRSRRVDMADTLADVLRDLQRAHRAEALKKGWGEVPVWVFCSTTGAPLDANNLRKRVFHKVLEKAGLRQIRMHDLRHGFASLLLAAGESIAYVRDQLGHSSIQLTVDVYGHLIPGANKKAVDRLADAIECNPRATKHAAGQE